MKFNLTAAHKFYLTLFLALVLLGAAAYFMPFYLFGKIRDSANRIERAKEEIALADRRLTESRAREEQMSAYGVGLEEVHSHFFSPKESLRVIEAAENIGKITKTVVEIGVLDTKDNVARFRFSATGSYSDVIRFVRLVENAPIYFEIENYWLERAAPASFGGADSLSGPRALLAAPASNVRATLTVKAFQAE
ncbi:MAG: hypothetical protein UY71_C0001G0047 [Parcubacteria group bacterium GW2011_GWB1_52_7]|nr:MAG: hypothetical protein UY64_C0014G0032 [Parcubacteria group bacterium GW2011_GWA1_51_12]KKW29237.1 MAG: hypothetical protein UY71_C0001G0047 [Parcubacteria group bacterium GW2011_GWB1_52_7]